jgi:hypothetical protein
MRRAMIVALGALALGVVTGLPGASAAGTKKAFTQTLVGGQIAGSGVKTVNAYQVKDSVNGDGAAVQRNTVTGTTFPLPGTDTVDAYFTNGRQTTKDTYALGQPDANGIVAITGSGKCTSGTGVHKGEKCSYTFTGTLDSKTSIVHVTVNGTYTR